MTIFSNTCFFPRGTCKIERGSRSDSYSCSIGFRFDSRKKGFCKRLPMLQFALLMLLLFAIYPGASSVGGDPVSGAA